MKQIDRYLLREIVPPLLVASGLVVLGIFLLQFRRLATAALGVGFTLQDAFAILIAALPPFLVLAIPIAYLLCVLVALGRLAQDLEIQALLSCGIHPVRIALVPIALGVLTSAVCVPIAWIGEPLGFRILHRTLVEVGVRNLQHAIRPGIFNEEFTGTAVHAREQTPHGVLKDILLFDERDPARAILIAAEAGEVQTPDGGRLLFALTSGEVHLVGSATATKEHYDRMRFERATLGLNTEAEIMKRTRFLSPISRMTSSEMREEIARLGSADAYARRVEKMLWRRLAFPTMAVVFSVVGAALALAARTLPRSIAAVIAILSVVAYYLLTRIADLAVVRDIASPFWMAWLPNLVLFSLGTIALLRSTHPR